MTGGCGPYLADTMKRLGYRTFGIGKFHTSPWDEKLGYDVHLHSEELYATPDQRARDSFAAWIRAERPAYNFIEGLMGERTEMYYMPQMSRCRRMPQLRGGPPRARSSRLAKVAASLTSGSSPSSGRIRPTLPPIPFNRLYDPDRLPNPIRGELEVDHMDEQIPWMNHAIWAERHQRLPYPCAQGSIMARSLISTPVSAGY
jgi:arylsulfatase